MLVNAGAEVSLKCRKIKIVKSYQIFGIKHTLSSAKGQVRSRYKVIYQID